MSRLVTILFTIKVYTNIDWAYLSCDLIEKGYAKISVNQYKIKKFLTFHIFLLCLFFHDLSIVYSFVSNYSAFEVSLITGNTLLISVFYCANNMFRKIKSVVTVIT